VREKKYVAPIIDGRHRTIRTISLLLMDRGFEFFQIKRLDGLFDECRIETLGWRIIRHSVRKGVA
jgi:hypothetical protein